MTERWVLGGDALRQNGGFYICRAHSIGGFWCDCVVCVFQSSRWSGVTVSVKLDMDAHDLKILMRNCYIDVADPKRTQEIITEENESCTDSGFIWCLLQHGSKSFQQGHW